MVVFCKGAKLKVRVGTGLTCWCYGNINSSNAIVFTKDGARDKQADLSIAKSTVNVEITKDLLCFVCNNRRRDKVSSGVIDPSGKEIFSTVFIWHPGLWFIPETVMVILLKLLLRFLGRRSLLFIFIFRLYIFEFI